MSTSKWSSENILKWFQVAAIIFFALQYSSFPLWDPDFWWHINNGRYIIEHGALPDRDYSLFTPTGISPQRETVILKGYWFAQIILYGVYHGAGVAGVILMRTGILTFTLVLARRFMRGGNPYLITANLLLLGSTLLYFTGERPQTLVFPLAIVLFIIMQNYFDKRGRAFFFLPLVTLLWSNLHGSVLFAAVPLVVYAFFAAIKKRDESKEAGFFIVACAAALAAIFLSPAREGMLVSFFRFQDSIFRSSTTETLSPLEIFSTFSIVFLGDWMYLILTAMILIVNIKRLPIPVITVVAASAVLSLFGTRYMVFFALTTPLLFRSPEIRIGGFFQKMILAASIIPIILSVNISKPLNFTIHERYPVPIVDTLHAGRPERIFAPSEWGGFLEYHLPDARLFMDGRLLNEDTLVQYFSILNGIEYSGQKEWKWYLDRYRVGTIAVPHRDFLTGEPVALVQRLRESREWAIIADNGNHIVFTREKR